MCAIAVIVDCILRNTFTGLCISSK